MKLVVLGAVIIGMFSSILCVPDFCCCSLYDYFRHTSPISIQSRSSPTQMFLLSAQLFLLSQYSQIGYFNKACFALKLRKLFFHKLFAHSFDKQRMGLSPSTSAMLTKYCRPGQSEAIYFFELQFWRWSSPRLRVSYSGSFMSVTFHPSIWMAETGKRCGFSLWF